jgi:hypothetical protein
MEAPCRLFQGANGARRRGVGYVKVFAPRAWFRIDNDCIVVRFRNGLVGRERLVQFTYPQLVEVAPQNALRVRYLDFDEGNDRWQLGIRESYFHLLSTLTWFNILLESAPPRI